jgi:putative hydrolase
MIDLHTHSLFSDGDLLPSELARRAVVKGYEVLAITDHVDASNAGTVVPALVIAAESINRSMKIRVIPGCEITHVAPSDIPGLAAACRKLGARIIVVHGETLVEPVAEGTNRSALESDIDILAHPGVLAGEDAAAAARRGIAIEVSARKGHCFGNGRVIRLWYEHRFPLVVNTDTHSPGDLIDDAFTRRLLIASGLAPDDTDAVLKDNRAFALKVLDRG